MTGLRKYTAVPMPITASTPRTTSHRRIAYPPAPHAIESRGRAGWQLTEILAGRPGLFREDGIDLGAGRRLAALAAAIDAGHHCAETQHVRECALAQPV